jgi:hypothetical protein
MSDFSSEQGGHTLQEQQIHARSLQTDLINLGTGISQMTISAPSNAIASVVENAESKHNVDDYGRNIAALALSSTAPDGTNKNESHYCCICLEAYEEAHAAQEAHTAFEITACSHMVGKSCLSRWLNCPSPNANTCPYCRKQLFERPESQPSQIDTLEEVTQLWTRVEHTMAKLLQLCEQRRERFGCQGTIGGVLREFLKEVNYEFFLNDVGCCLEYVEGPEPWVLLRSVDWHA